MTQLTRRRLTMLWSVMLGIAAVGACNKKADASASASASASATSGGLDTVGAGAAEEETQDPCTLLSASEAEKFVGTLATPPYRANDSHASTSGDACMYRSKDGRALEVKAHSHGAEAAGDAMESIPGKLGAALSKGGASGMDTVANRVMAKGPAGPWDKATWIPGGSLFVTKDDAMVVVDVTGTSGKESDAVAIATLIAPRIGHPLDYDGAKAVALVPKPPAHSGNPCEFVSRTEVEAAIGKLSADPVPDSSESRCTYRVETSNGTREYPVSYTWEGGARGLNMMKHSMSAFGGVMGMSSTSVLDTMKPTGQMGDLLGGLVKVASGGSMHTAAGAAATTGLRTDTTLAGPWDQAMLFHGTQLMAVRHDAMVDISLTSADYERAKALLTTIANKL